jgi:YegS/Rv2252/BmrU family lipid kinase
MPATVILNPYANRWETGKRAPEVESVLRQAGFDFEMKITEGPLHGTDLAREAVENGDTPLIAAGGDGTISEIMNGLMQATPHDARPAGPIGLLPLGTANDFTDVLGIPHDLNEAVRVITAGHTRTIDLGTVNGHYFDNNSAVGLEPVVSIENIRLTWLRGMIRYLVAAVIAIMKRPTWDAHMEWDDGEYKGSITLTSVGNSHRTGGVFYMTPNAILDDGKLDFVFAPALGRLRLFQMLPKTQTGVHVHEPEVQEHRTTRLTIRTKSPTPIQADGELIATEETEIVYQVVPGALSLYSPEP